MSMKKWLVAIGIVGVLAIAFFWGGNSPKSSNQTAVSSIASQPGEIPTSTLMPEKQMETKQAADSPQPEAAAQKDEPSKPDIPQETKPASSIQEAIPADKPAAPVVTNSAPPAAETSKPEPSTQPQAGTKEPEPKKDKYLTDPIPEGKPKPVEWQDVTINKKKALTATLSVTCKTILDNMSSFNKDKLEVLPKDGVIYQAQTVTFYEGESVFDVLLREMKKNKIHMEFSMTPIYNSNYIEGIHNIYEFDCGELSGWMYKVNGWFPNYGASRYVLKDGDVIDWVYTCDLGRDVGDGKAAGGGKK
ncbi:DUF4430 domain-containing protein [Paenibacillus planticolens]|uniref:DUF4430 domain-containing protein n=1 Tax=Paenibacillus planticolens TaxID=2654976 RepID=A0ABX1ZZP0_9BACL|nr:DUF4430 domain-containing protein [Paenibacillus planticolens]NOV04324.1 DUF4430 domain-containing protein [Paenibacillus planticolens]